MHNHSLEVDLDDLLTYNGELGQRVHEKPGEMVPLVSWRLRVLEADRYSSSRLCCGLLGLWSALLRRMTRSLRQRLKLFPRCRSR